MEKRKLLRKEHFGATLYDIDTLTHKFLTHSELSSDLLKKIEIWETNLADAPENILFSPIRIYYELTRKCNLRCKTCFNSSGINKNNEMNTYEIKKSLKGLRKNNVFDIRFTGGEPTQRDDWFEILKYAKDLGFAVSLNTNGVYSRKEILEKLLKLDLDQITISLDGYRKTHDYLRGAGTFDKAIESLKYLYSNGGKTRINTLITKNILKDYNKILKIAGKYAHEINFFYMRIVGRALNILDQVVNYNDLKYLDKKIEEEKTKYHNTRILHGSQVMLRNSVLTKKYGLQIGGPDGFTRMNLLADGSIYAGGYAPYINSDLNLGNIKDENYSILNIWRNSKKLWNFRKRSLKLQKICGQCTEKINHNCPGASMEMILVSEANKDIQNPYCSMPNILSKMYED